jgi:hypothetical protein
MFDLYRQNEAYRNEIMREADRQRLAKEIMDAQRRERNNRRQSRKDQ